MIMTRHMLWCLCVVVATIIHATKALHLSDEFRSEERLLHGATLIDEDTNATLPLADWVLGSEESLKQQPITLTISCTQSCEGGISIAQELFESGLATLEEAAWNTSTDFALAITDQLPPTVTFVGNVDALQAVLASNPLVFTPAKNQNGQQEILIEVSQLDKIVRSKLLIRVQAVNDLPVIVAPPTIQVTTQLPGKWIEIGSDIAVSDNDSEERVVGAIAATLSVEHGELKCDSPPGTLVNQTTLRSVDITGTIEKVNTVLRSFKFRWPSNSTSIEPVVMDTLSITVRDSANSGKLPSNGNIVSQSCPIQGVKSPTLPEITLGGSPSMIVSENEAQAMPVYLAGANPSEYVDVSLLCSCGSLEFPQSDRTVAMSLVGTQKLYQIHTHMARAQSILQSVRYVPKPDTHTKFGEIMRDPCTVEISFEVQQTGLDSRKAPTQTVRIDIETIDRMPEVMVENVHQKLSVIQGSSVRLQGIDISDKNENGLAWRMLKLEVQWSPVSAGNVYFDDEIGLDFQESEGVAVIGRSSRLRQASQSLRFRASSTWNGNVSAWIQVSDHGDTPTLIEELEPSWIIEVVPLHRRAHITIPSRNLTVDEGIPLQLKGLAIGNILDTSEQVTVSLQATHGTIAVSERRGVSLLSRKENLVVIQGSVSDMNHVLMSATYLPTPNWYGVGSVQVICSSESTSIKSSPSKLDVIVHVQTINQRKPVIQQTQPFLIPFPGGKTVLGESIVVRSSRDSNDGDRALMHLTLLVSTGTGTLTWRNPSNSGATRSGLQSYNASKDSSFWEFVGTTAALNDALSLLDFQHNLTSVRYNLDQVILSHPKIEVTLNELGSDNKSKEIINAKVIVDVEPRCPEIVADQYVIPVKSLNNSELQVISLPNISLSSATLDVPRYAVEVSSKTSDTENSNSLGKLWLQLNQTEGLRSHIALFQTDSKQINFEVSSFHLFEAIRSIRFQQTEEGIQTQRFGIIDLSISALEHFGNQVICTTDVRFYVDCPHVSHKGVDVLTLSHSCKPGHAGLVQSPIVLESLLTSNLRRAAQQQLSTTDSMSIRISSSSNQNLIFNNVPDTVRVDPSIGKSSELFITGKLTSLNEALQTLEHDCSLQDRNTDDQVELALLVETNWVVFANVHVSIEATPPKYQVRMTNSEPVQVGEGDQISICCIELLSNGKRRSMTWEHEGVARVLIQLNSPMSVSDQHEGLQTLHVREIEKSKVQVTSLQGQTQLEVIGTAHDIEEAINEFQLVNLVTSFGWNTLYANRMATITFSAGAEEWDWIENTKLGVVVVPSFQFASLNSPTKKSHKALTPGTWQQVSLASLISNYQSDMRTLQQYYKAHVTISARNAFILINWVANTQLETGIINEKDQIESVATSDHQVIKMFGSVESVTEALLQHTKLLPSGSSDVKLFVTWLLEPVDAIWPKGDSYFASSLQLKLNTVGPMNWESTYEVVQACSPKLKLASSSAEVVIDEDTSIAFRNTVEIQNQCEHQVVALYVSCTLCQFDDVPDNTDNVVCRSKDGASEFNCHGTKEHLNAALAIIRYEPVPNLNGFDTINFVLYGTTRTQTGIEGSLGNILDEIHIEVEIVAVNDAPEILCEFDSFQVPVVGKVPLAGISIRDVDLHEFSVHGNIAKVTIQISHGALSFAGNLPVATSYNVQQRSYTLLGSLEQLNSAFSGMYYTADEGQALDGTAMLTVTVDDNGNSGLSLIPSIASRVFEIQFRESTSQQGAIENDHLPFFVTFSHTPQYVIEHEYTKLTLDQARLFTAKPGYSLDSNTLFDVAIQAVNCELQLDLEGLDPDAQYLMTIDEEESPLRKVLFRSSLDIATQLLSRLSVLPSDNFNIGTSKMILSVNGVEFTKEIVLFKRVSQAALLNSRALELEDDPDATGYASGSFDAVQLSGQESTDTRYMVDIVSNSTESEFILLDYDATAIGAGFFQTSMNEVHITGTMTQLNLAFRALKYRVPLSATDDQLYQVHISVQSIGSEGTLLPDTFSTLVLEVVFHEKSYSLQEKFYFNQPVFEGGLPFGSVDEGDEIYFKGMKLSSVRGAVDDDLRVVLRVSSHIGWVLVPPTDQLAVTYSSCAVNEPRKESMIQLLAPPLDTNMTLNREVQSVVIRTSLQDQIQKLTMNMSTTDHNSLASFRLGIQGTGFVTDLIPRNADADQVKNALENTSEQIKVTVYLSTVVDGSITSKTFSITFLEFDKQVELIIEDWSNNPEQVTHLITTSVAFTQHERGNVVLEFNGERTKAISNEADETQIQQALEDLNGIGHVSVSKTAQAYRSSEDNNYLESVWEVTFGAPINETEYGSTLELPSHRGKVPLLVVHPSEINGFIETFVNRSTSSVWPVSGTFDIICAGAQTEPIPHDASAVFVKEQLLKTCPNSVELLSVSRSPATWNTSNGTETSITWTVSYVQTGFENMVFQTVSTDISFPESDDAIFRGVSTVTPCSELEVIGSFKHVSQVVPKLKYRGRPSLSGGREDGDFVQFELFERVGSVSSDQVLSNIAVNVIVHGKQDPIELQIPTSVTTHEDVAIFLHSARHQFQVLGGELKSTRPSFLTMKLVAEHGKFKVEGRFPGVRAVREKDGSLLLRGTQSTLNDALLGVVYVPAKDWNSASNDIISKRVEQIQLSAGPLKQYSVIKISADMGIISGNFTITNTLSDGSETSEPISIQAVASVMQEGYGDTFGQGIGESFESRLTALSNWPEGITIEVVRSIQYDSKEVTWEIRYFQAVDEVYFKQFHFPNLSIDVSACVASPHGSVSSSIENVASGRLTTGGFSLSYGNKASIGSIPFDATAEDMYQILWSNEYIQNDYSKGIKVSKNTVKRADGLISHSNWRITFNSDSLVLQDTSIQIIPGDSSNWTLSDSSATVSTSILSSSGSNDDVISVEVKTDHDDFQVAYGTVRVTVLPVHDDIDIIIDGVNEHDVLTVDENSSLRIPEIQVHDIDATSSQTYVIELSASYGSLVNWETNSFHITIKGTYDELNRLLKNDLIFTPDENWNGITPFRIQLTCPNGNVVSRDFWIQVMATNNPPELRFPSGGIIMKSLDPIDDEFEDYPTFAIDITIPNNKFEIHDVDVDEAIDGQLEISIGSTHPFSFPEQLLTMVRIMRENDSDNYELVVRGDLGSLNRLLNSLRYHSYALDANLHISVNDLGNTGTGETLLISFEVSLLLHRSSGNVANVLAPKFKFMSISNQQLKTSDSQFVSHSGSLAISGTMVSYNGDNISDPVTITLHASFGYLTKTPARIEDYDLLVVNQQVRETQTFEEGSSTLSFDCSSVDVANMLLDGILSYHAPKLWSGVDPGRLTVTLLNCESDRCVTGALPIWFNVEEEDGGVFIQRICGTSCDQVWTQLQPGRRTSLSDAGIEIQSSSNSDLYQLEINTVVREDIGQSLEIEIIRDDLRGIALEATTTKIVAVAGRATLESLLQHGVEIGCNSCDPGLHYLAIKVQKANQDVADTNAISSNLQLVVNILESDDDLGDGLVTVHERATQGIRIREGEETFLGKIVSMNGWSNRFRMLNVEIRSETCDISLNTQPNSDHHFRLLETNVENVVAVEVDTQSCSTILEKVRVRCNGWYGTTLLSVSMQSNEGIEQSFSVKLVVSKDPLKSVSIQSSSNTLWVAAEQHSVKVQGLTFLGIEYATIQNPAKLFQISFQTFSQHGKLDFRGFLEGSHILEQSTKHIVLQVTKASLLRLAGDNAADSLPSPGVYFELVAGHESTVSTVSVQVDDGNAIDFTIRAMATDTEAPRVLLNSESISLESLHVVHDQPIVLQDVFVVESASPSKLIEMVLCVDEPGTISLPQSSEFSVITSRGEDEGKSWVSVLGLLDDLNKAIHIVELYSRTLNEGTWGEIVIGVVSARNQIGMDDFGPAFNGDLVTLSHYHSIPVYFETTESGVFLDPRYNALQVATSGIAYQLQNLQVQRKVGIEHAQRIVVSIQLTSVYGLLQVENGITVPTSTTISSMNDGKGLLVQGPVLEANYVLEYVVYITAIQGWSSRETVSIEVWNGLDVSLKPADTGVVVIDVESENEYNHFVECPASSLWIMENQLETIHTVFSGIRATTTAATEDDAPKATALNISIHSTHNKVQFELIRNENSVVESDQESGKLILHASGLGLVRGDVLEVDISNSVQLRGVENWCGHDHIVIVASDDLGHKSTCEFGVTVSCVNNAPRWIISEPSFTVSEDSNPVEVKGLVLIDNDELEPIVNLSDSFSSHLFSNRLYKVRVESLFGTLSLPLTAGLRWNFPSITSESQIGSVLTGNIFEFEGPLARCNEVLGKLKYQPVKDWYGQDTIKLYVEESDSADTASASTVEVWVDPREDPPNIFGPRSLVVPYEGGGTHLATCEISHPDGQQEMNVRYLLQVHSYHGEIKVRDVSQLSGNIQVTTVKEGLLQLDGTLHDLNSALKQLFYFAEDDYNGLDVVTLSLSAPGGLGSILAEHSINLQTLSTPSHPVFKNDGQEVKLEMVEDTVLALGEYLEVSDTDGHGIDNLDSSLQVYAKVLTRSTPAVQTISLRATSPETIAHISLRASEGFPDPVASDTIQLSLDCSTLVPGLSSTTTLIRLDAVGSRSEELVGSSHPSSIPGASFESKLNELSCLQYYGAKVSAARISVANWRLELVGVPLNLPRLEVTSLPVNSEAVVEMFRFADPDHSSFQVRHDGYVSPTVSYFSTNAEVQQALESLPTLNTVRVESKETNSKDTSERLWEITVLDPPGRISLFQYVPIELENWVVHVTHQSQGSGVPDLYTISTRAVHVDEVQFIRTQSSGDPISGGFRLSMNLAALGESRVVVSTLIDHDAVPMISDESTTFAVGSGRGESVQSKIQQMLADYVVSKHYDTNTDQITVSVTRTDMSCPYECYNPYPALATTFAGNPLYQGCAKHGECDLCVGYCVVDPGDSSGDVITNLRCIESSSCVTAMGASSRCSMLGTDSDGRRYAGSCFSSGFGCTGSGECAGTGRCLSELSDCSLDPNGDHIWKVTFHNAPYNLPMMEVYTNELNSATNAEVAVDVVMDRSPAVPLIDGQPIGGEFQVSLNGQVTKRLDTTISTVDLEEELFKTLQQLLPEVNFGNAKSTLRISESPRRGMDGGRKWTLQLLHAPLDRALNLTCSGSRLTGHHPFIVCRPLETASMKTTKQLSVLGTRGVKIVLEDHSQLVLQGDAFSINEALNTLQLIPPKDYYGPLSVVSQLRVLKCENESRCEASIASSTDISVDVLHVEDQVLLHAKEQVIETVEDKPVSLGDLSFVDVDQEDTLFELVIDLKEGSGSVRIGWDTTSSSGLLRTSGTRAEIMRILSNLVYTPNTSWNGIEVVYIAVQELETSDEVVQRSKSSELELRIIVSPIAQTPTISCAQRTLEVLEDSTLCLGTMSVGHCDTAGLLSCQVQNIDDENEFLFASAIAQFGSFRLIEIPKVLLVSGGKTVAATILKFKGKASDLEEAINSLVYQAPENYFGDDQITFLVSRSQHLDPFNAESRFDIKLNVLSKPDPPLLVVQNSTVKVYEDGDLLFRSDNTNDPLIQILDQDVAYTQRTSKLFSVPGKESVDEVQFIRTQSSGDPISGGFRLSMNLAALGESRVVVSTLIDHDAVPMISDESTTFAVGSGRGESVQSKIQQMLADYVVSKHYDTNTDQITVSVTRTDMSCPYECYNPYPALATTFAGNPLYQGCAKHEECDLCVGYCVVDPGDSSGDVITNLRCIESSSCVTAMGASSRCSMLGTDSDGRRYAGSCFSSGFGCTGSGECAGTGRCLSELSDCSPDPNGDHIWKVTFHNAPYNLPMMEVYTNELNSATNAEVAVDVVMDRSPAMPLFDGAAVEGSISLRFGGELTSMFDVRSNGDIILAEIQSACSKSQVWSVVELCPFLNLESPKLPNLRGGVEWRLEMQNIHKDLTTWESQGLIRIEASALKGAKSAPEIRSVSLLDADPTHSAKLVDVEVAFSGWANLNASTWIGNGTFTRSESSLVLGGASIHDANLWLSTITYKPKLNLNSAEHGHDSIHITVTMKDNGLNAGASVSVWIDPVNDLPVIMLPGDQLHELEKEDDGLSNKVIGSSLWVIAEDTPTVLGKMFAIRDVDSTERWLGNDGQIEVSVYVSNGTLDIPDNWPIRHDLNHVVDRTNLVSFQATLDVANSAIQQISYVPALHFMGTDMMVISVWDRGNTGYGPENGYTVSRKLSIQVNSVVDSPQIHIALDNGQKVLYAIEDQDTVLDGLHFSDAESFSNSETNYTVHVTVGDSSFLSLTEAVDVEFLSGSGYRDSQFAVQGSLSGINRAFQRSVFHGASNLNTDKRDYVNIDVKVTSTETGQQAQETLFVSIQGVDDPSRLTFLDNVSGERYYLDEPIRNTTIYSHEDSPVLLGNLRIQDADVLSGVNEKIVRVDLEAKYGFLSISQFEALELIQGFEEPESRFLSIRGNVFAVNKALSSAVYYSKHNWNGLDVVEIVCSSEQHRSVGRVWIDVAAVNDSPKVALSSQLVARLRNAFEDQTQSLRGISVSDVDATPSEIMTLTMEAQYGSVSTGRIPGECVLVSGTGYQDELVVVECSLASINTLLHSTVYDPPSHMVSQHAGELDVIRVWVRDSGGEDELSPGTGAETIYVELAPVVDKLELSIQNEFVVGEVCKDGHCEAIPRTKLWIVNEDTSTVLPNTTISYPDEGTTNSEIHLQMSCTYGRLIPKILEGVQVLSSNAQLESDGTTTLYYVGSLVGIQSLLQSVEYLPQPNYNGVDKITLKLQIWPRDIAKVGLSSTQIDGQHEVVERHIPVLVEATNDPPKWVVDGAIRGQLGVALASWEINQDEMLRIESLRVMDPDYTSFLRNPRKRDQSPVREHLEVTVEAKYGLISFTSTVNGVSFEEGTQHQSERIRIRGSMPHINRALEQVTYHPPPSARTGFDGTDEIMFYVNDLGGYLGESFALSEDSHKYTRIELERCNMELSCNHIKKLRDEYPNSLDSLLYVHVQVNPVKSIPYVLYDHATQGISSGSLTNLVHLTVKQGGKLALSKFAIGDEDADKLKSGTLPFSGGAYTFRIASQLGEVELLRASKRPGVFEYSSSHHVMQFKCGNIDYLNGALEYLQYIAPVVEHGDDQLVVTVDYSNSNEGARTSVSSLSYQILVTIENVNHKPVLRLPPIREQLGSAHYHVTSGQSVFLGGASRQRITTTLNGEWSGVQVSSTCSLGFELWRSEVVRPRLDSGTWGSGKDWRAHLVKDINVGSSSSSPQWFTTFGTDTYFVATDHENGRELWRTDGTALGTALVKDLSPGSPSSNPSQLFVHSGHLYFAANGVDLSWQDTSDSCKGWKSSKLAPQFVYARSISTTWDVEQRFDCPTGYHWASSYEVIKYYGTATSMHGRGVEGSKVSQGPSAYGDDCGTVFTSGSYRFQLSDSLQTGIYKDGRFPDNHPPFEDTEFMDDNAVHELSDFAGILCVETITEQDSAHCLATRHEYNGQMERDCFSRAGTELWKSDGTVSGTYRLKDINTGTAGSFPMHFESFQGTLYFQAATTNHGVELWQTDGTRAGTFMAVDLNPGIASSYPSGMTTTGDGSRMFFASSLIGYGSELRVMFDTAIPMNYEMEERSRFVGLLDLWPGVTGSSPREITSLGNGQIVVFVADHPTYGTELWASDGTVIGTGVVADLAPGNMGSNPHGLVEHNGQIYFTADDGVHGTELWVVGTGGQIVILDAVGTGYITIGFAQVVGDALGPTARPKLVTELVNGPSKGKVPKFAAAWEDRVLFAVEGKASHGNELWETDGTIGGTKRTFTRTGPDFEIEESWDGIETNARFGVKVGVGVKCIYFAGRVCSATERLRVDGSHGTSPGGITGPAGLGGIFIQDADHGKLELSLKCEIGTLGFSSDLKAPLVTYRDTTENVSPLEVVARDYPGTRLMRFSGNVDELNKVLGYIAYQSVTGRSYVEKVLVTVTDNHEGVEMHIVSETVLVRVVDEIV